MKVCMAQLLRTLLRIITDIEVQLLLASMEHQDLEQILSCRNKRHLCY